MFRTRPIGPTPAADADGRPVRVSHRRRRRDTGGSAMAAGLLARLVHLVVGIVALIIVAGILLVVLNANATNSIVSAVHDTGRTLVGPFDGMFSFHSAHAAIAVNWGIAAFVYLFIGGLIARLIGRLARG